MKNEALSVFISYSHEDESYRIELEKHLSLLKRQGVVTTWNDRKIDPGREWEGVISDNLRSADIILFLVSSDFLASDYCYDVEVQIAMDRHGNGDAVVVPVILRHVDLSGEQFMSLQALPRDAIPVAKWSDADEAFCNIAEGIRRIAASINSGRNPKDVVVSEFANQQVFPKPSPAFVDRIDDVKGLENQLSISRLVTLVGPPGVGKTEIAKKLVAVLSEKGVVGEGVAYIDLQGVTIPGSLVSLIGNALGLDRITDVQAISENIKNRSILIVLDNVEWALRVAPQETRSVIRHLHDYTNAPKILATSRQHIGVPGVESAIAISPLPEEPSKDLFGKLLELNGHTVEEDYVDEVANKLLGLMDGLPLAIVLASSSVVEWGSNGFLQEWEESKTKVLEIPGLSTDAKDALTSVDFSIALSVGDLSENEYICLELLSQLPSGATATLLREIAKTLAPEMKPLLEMRSLLSRSLVYKDKERYRVLVPIREYVNSELSDESAGKIAAVTLRVYLPSVGEMSNGIYKRGGLEKIQRLSVEMPNIAYLLDRCDSEDAILVDTVLSLSEYYRVKGLYQEALYQFERIRNLRPLPMVDEELGHICRNTSYLEKAEALYDCAIRGYEQEKNADKVATCSRRMADILRMKGRFKEAVSYANMALHVNESGARDLDYADSLETRADIDRMLGNCSKAEQGYEQALAIYDDVGGLLGRANSLRSLAQIDIFNNSLITAKERIRESHSISEDIGDYQGVGNALLIDARVNLLQGQIGDVKERLEAAMECFVDIDGSLGLSVAHYLMGRYLEHEGESRTEIVARYDEAIRGFQEMGLATNLYIAMCAKDGCKDKYGMSSEVVENFRKFDVTSDDGLDRWPLEIRGSVLHNLS
ncbi:MAG: tetratricopeptide repeat protein [Candidatus Thiodiazotropha sp.]